MDDYYYYCKMESCIRCTESMKKKIVAKTKEKKNWLQTKLHMEIDVAILSWLGHYETLICEKSEG